MLPRFLVRFAFLALVSFALSGVAMADTSPEVRLVKIAISGSPLKSFDISWTDPTTGRYYLADRSNKSLDVFDSHENAQIKQIGGFVGFTGNNDTSGPDGVVATSHREVWVGDGDSTVKVVDVSSGTITDSISTGGKARADELAYDPNDQLIVIANDADDPPFLSYISTSSHKMLGKIEVPDATDGIEQTVWDPTSGLFYVAIPATKDRPGGEIMVLDANMKTVGTTPTASCNPHGLALGPGRQLLAGCNASSHTLLLDTSNWSVMADFPQLGGSDEVWYNPGDNRYYTANNTGQYMGVIDAGSMQWVENAETGVGAHSVAADQSLNHVFVPVAAPDPACPHGCIAVFSSVTSDRANP